jgi:hypothetical protein
LSALNHLTVPSGMLLPYVIALGVG